MNPAKRKNTSTTARKNSLKATPKSAAARLRLQEDFFRVQISPRQLLEAFDHLPGLRYFVKDARSRVMALSSRRVAHLGLSSEEDIIGLTDRDYLPAEIADKFLADDQWVIQNGKSLRNRVEMGMDDTDSAIGRSPINTRSETPAGKWSA